MTSMLKIQKINFFDFDYKGEKYRFIEAEVIFDDDDFTITENFAPDRLGNLLLKDGKPVSHEAYIINNNIYAYVPDDLCQKAEAEIKKWIEKETD